MSDLSEVFCIIDTREQNKNRINAVTEFIESHGGAVEHSKLDLCDYKIEGIFREKEICIGIEAKSLTDFSGSYQELPDKLARSFELYNDVALFVEIPQIRTSSSDGFHATIVNPAVTDGTADVLQYAVLQNSLESWQRDGVHVRQLQSETLWGYAIASVLISITKDTHRGLEITKVKDFRSQYLNILSKFEGIGQKTALKVIQHYPNFYWLSTMHEDDLKEKLGKVTGSKLHKFLTNNELYTAEWMAGNNEPCKDTKDKEKCAISHPEQSSEVLSSSPELKYLDEHKGKCIEVPKGKYQNGGQILDKIIECSICGVGSDCAYVNPKTMLCNACQNNEDFYEAEDKKEVIKSQLSNTGQLEGQSAGRISQPKKKPTDNPASQTLADAGSQSSSTKSSESHTITSSSTQQDVGTHGTLPESPDNSEFTANPRLKDIVEFIRRHPRKLDDVEKEFGLSKDYTFRALNELWHKKKIWLNKATLCWEYGCDKNPVPVVADKEYEVM